MRVSTFASAILSIAGIASAVNEDKSGCENGPWIPPTKAGIPWENAPESHLFCEAGHVDGNILTGIRVWRGDWAVWGLSFKWGDGDFGKVYGDNTDGTKYREPDQELQWSSTDEVVIKLWDNNGKSGLDAVGWVQVWVNGDKKLTQGSDHTGSEVTFETGSKRIIALQGKSQSQGGTEKGLIQTLQFHYLESKIVSAAMTSITYLDEMDKYNNEKKGIDPSATIGSAWLENRNPIGGLNQTFNINEKIEYTNSKSIVSSQTHTVGTSFSIKIGIDAGIPGLVEKSTEITREIKYDYQKMDSRENTESRTEGISVTVGSTPAGYPPQTATLCVAKGVSGNFESDYTAEITAKLANGKTFVFKDYGHAKSITYADVTMSCETMPLDQKPNNGIPVRKGIDVNGKRRAVQFNA